MDAGGIGMTVSQVTRGLSYCYVCGTEGCDNCLPGGSAMIERDGLWFLPPKAGYDSDNLRLGDLLYYPAIGEKCLVIGVDGMTITAKLLFPRLSWWRRLLGQKYVSQRKPHDYCILVGTAQ